MTRKTAPPKRPLAGPLLCEVEDIFPFGVFVRMPDGERGYIRRRELTLSGDKDPRTELVVGQKLQAVLLPADAAASAPDRSPELSVRAALPDPWPEFARRRKVEDVVAATVKHLFADGVLVEIVPGVDGYIPLRELSPGVPPPAPDELLWPGDHVEATILLLDARQNRLILSLRRRLEQMIMAEGVREKLDQTAERPLSTAATSVDELSAVGELSGDAPIAIDGTILVVEDRAGLREPLLNWLRERACDVQGASSAEEAIELCKRQDFAVGIFDLDIPKINGVALITKLRELQNNMPIAVMSGPDLIVEQWTRLQPLGIAACFPKPLDLDELAQSLAAIGRGESQASSLALYGDGNAEEIAAFQNITATIRSRQRVTDRLKTALDQLVDEAGADKGIIFRLDPASGSVTIVATAGTLRLNRTAIPFLQDSPVKDVIRESTLLIERRASDDRIGRLRNLLPLLTFESFLGIPLEAGGRTEHALFLFGRRPGAFPKHALREALSVAFLMQAVLEGQILEQRLEKAGGILLSGQLSSAFGHEVFNRVTSLDLQMRLLSRSLDRFDGVDRDSDRGAGLDELRTLAEMTVQAVVELRQTVGDFQRLMRTTDEQIVNVNLALRSAETQVQPIALRKDVRIYVELAPDLPDAQGSSVRIQQVFLNLILNAVQQMSDLDPRRRILRVSSCLVSDESGARLQIRFSDTGPGIHRRLWEKIFALGYTTRENGSGLGLFIARSLVESIGGRIGVEESRLLMGTTFLVELPAVT